ncbi:MAG: HEAT repeat domain-containing protein, partial [bacterium]|nr:HEAT repeat domain-containing protein [bacterium]
KDYDIRKEAADMLGVMRPDWAVQPLELLLKDDEYSVRLAAIEALGNIGKAKVIPLLIKALYDDYIDNKHIAAHRINEILGDQDILYEYYDEEQWNEDVNSFIQWWNKNSSQFNPELCYFNGRILSIENWISEMEKEPFSKDMNVMRLIASTGQNLGSAYTPSIEKLWRNWWEDNKQRFEPGKHYCYGYEVKNEMITDEGKELMQHYDKKCDNINQIYAKLKKGEFDEYKKMLIYLNDEYDGIWEYAFEILIRVGLSQSIDTFLSFLKDNNSSKRANALYGLRNIAIVNKVVPH